MLKSVDALRLVIRGPLEDACGPQARMLTAEVHGTEVRGLALCPGRVVCYVMDERLQRLQIDDRLRLTKASRKPAA
ncbi:hypothetical protein FZZ91_03705 [Synechococcus sp. HB1133]|uniref:hypothetical protein n=1 Tax=unclassified Synechococcus TaxID=2626047 RepID=UPI001409628F|nr:MULTISPECIES: hypothetical protein [unclassified Synechococcus]MCB4395045.1 hypothetical protein [Synechococcus sp. PH41509]MCB4421945.1 hypothetical protein [Synechococcus sp. HB1133]MCB4430108.1 hypothetical protein [Synechococcus sp. HBA1120]NHI80887.1 hypothetical protein [Synechococcus sp. HB1133]